MFSILMLVARVVMVNLIIAVLYSVEERVGKFQSQAQRSVRARLVRQSLVFSRAFPCLRTRFEPEDEYAYQLIPVSVMRKQHNDEERAGGWQGMLKASTIHLDRIIDAHTEVLRDELASLRVKVAESKDMRAEVSRIKADIVKIMKRMKLNRVVALPLGGALESTRRLKKASGSRMSQEGFNLPREAPSLTDVTPLDSRRSHVSAWI